MTKGSLTKWKFGVGISGNRTVTVNAYNEQDALEKARHKLDMRAEKANEEPPVSWTLYLIDAIDI